MPVRFYDPAADYETVCQWWNDWKWPALPASALPEYGFIAGDTEDIAVAWLYRTDSDIAILDWITTNRQIEDKERRGAAISAVISAGTATAMRLGFASVLSFVRNRHLARKLEGCGYSLSDDGVIILHKDLTLCR